VTAWIGPVRLEGDVVRLEPVGEQHVEGLLSAAAFPELWTWMPIAIDSEAVLRALLARAAATLAAGQGLSFATRALRTDEIVGSTSYLNVDEANRRVEIGFTWVTPGWQRSAVNTEAKLLMLRHAFEALGCERVELKTDAMNARSRAAIARLGAREEGTLRHHMIRPDGSFRDSVYFGIVRDEWPAVEARLRGFLERAAG